MESFLNMPEEMDKLMEAKQKSNFSDIQHFDTSNTQITEGEGMSNTLQGYNVLFGIETLIKFPKLLLILWIVGSFWYTTGKIPPLVPDPISDNVRHNPTRGVTGDSGDSSINDNNALKDYISVRGSAPEEGLPIDAPTTNKNSDMNSGQATHKNNSEAVDPPYPKKPTSPALSNAAVSDCSPCPSQPPIPNKPLKNAIGDKPNLTNKSLATFKTTVGKELIMLCTVKKGDLVSIQADGRILTGQGFAWNNPNGFDLEHATIPKSYFNINPNYKHGALLYRLHQKSAWMCYNTETPPTLSATEDGQLEFLINDTFREDNQGSFDIIVKIEHSTLEP